MGLSGMGYSYWVGLRWSSRSGAGVIKISNSVDQKQEKLRLMSRAKIFRGEGWILGSTSGVRAAPPRGRCGERS